MPDYDFDAVIIGGGVVGLGVSAALAGQGGSVVLLEQHDEFGRETSSRNSEVIHAGIYYETGSLKARLCVQGRRSLYEFCRAHDVPHRKCGKIVVAVTRDEEEALARLKQRAEANGVEGLELVSRGRMMQMEPRVVARAGLLSPESGIISAHGLMHALAAKAEAGGADLVRGAEVLGLDRAGDAWIVHYRDSEDEADVTARVVINAAGLGAGEVMRMAGLEPANMNLNLYYCKGEYFSVHGSKRRLVNMLVYPLPQANLMSLGIHTVVGLAGELKLGPSAFYVDGIDYRVDPDNRQDFCRDVQSYLPFIEAGDLAPDMSGIRPKLSGPGEPARDFYIAHEHGAGAPGFINLVGIDSPGLTASIAIGEHVASMVKQI